MKTESIISLGRDVVAYVPVKVIPALVGFASILILTKSFLPEEYGRYSAVMAIVIIASQLFGAWLSNSVMYLFEEASLDFGVNVFRGYLLIIQSVLAVPAAIIVFGVTFVFLDNWRLAISASLLVVGQLFFSLNLTFLQASRKIHTQTVVVASQCIIQIVGLLFFIAYRNGGEASAVLCVALGSFAGNLSLMAFNGGLKFSGIKLAEVRKIFFRVYLYGIPMCVWFFATQFYMLGDRIFLQYFGFSEHLGRYSSFRDLLVGCTSLFLMPLLMASYPILMQKWKSNSPIQELEILLSSSLMVLLLVFAPFAALVDVLGLALISNLFGKVYALSRTEMALILLSIFFNASAMHVQRGLELNGSTLVMAKLAFATAILFSFLIYFFTGVLGSSGALISVALSSLIYLSLVWWAVREVLRPKIPLAFFLRFISCVAAADVSLHFLFLIWHESLIYERFLATVAILMTIIYLHVRFDPIVRNKLKFFFN